jgi:GT2 family glycosyltransferase
MQRDAHVLLFLAWNDPKVDGIMTGKLFEYLYSKTPILSINNQGIEAAQKLIVEANAGVVYTEPEKIAEWLLSRLITSAKQPSGVTQQFLNRYDRNFLAMKLLDSCKRKMPACVIVVVTFNSQKYLPKAMECINQQTHSIEKIIIVDTGSDETAYLMPYQQQANVEIVFAEKNSGFCKGNNIGISKLPDNCDYVFFLNPDAFITPSFVRGAIAFLQLPQHQQYGAVTGTVLGYNIDVDQPNGAYDTTGIFRKWYGRWYDRGQGQAYNPGLYLVQEDLDAICGAVFFCRKKALDSIMLRENEVFNNTFYMYKEDIDLSLRLRREGWKLAFLPQLIAHHCRGWQKDRLKMPRKLRLHSAKNELRVHLQTMAPVPIAYSLCKYAAVKWLNI